VCLLKTMSQHTCMLGWDCHTCPRRLPALGYLIHASNDFKIGLKGVSVPLAERLSRQPHVRSPERQNHKSKT